MSRQLVQTSLPGYEGPVAVNAKELQDTIDRIPGFGFEILKVAARQAKPLRRIFRPTTDDGYAWFWGVEFNLHYGAVAILIPWSQDWNKTDGSGADRSIAAYVKGDVGSTEIRDLIYRLTSALNPPT